jgi:hypothetical protein
MCEIKELIDLTGHKKRRKAEERRPTILGIAYIDTGQLVEKKLLKFKLTTIEYLPKLL